jgi:uncharacterized membrane protein YgcG
MDLPIGSIIIWAGGTIPTGWALCNGANGTPDLREKFVRGASIDGDLLTSGGATTHVHTNGGTGSQGSHGHTGISGGSGSSGTSKFYGGSGDNAGGGHSHDIGNTISAIGNHSHAIGNTNPANHMPPHKYLQFIMRIS